MFYLIENNIDLEDLDKELLNHKLIGVDTEFRRKSKEDIKLALIQINNGDEIFLIDCIAIGQYQGNCMFLKDSSVCKIFHSFREDIEAIFSWTNQELKNTFDTQLANAFLGGSFSISYQNLVEKMLDVKIDKFETRSNWVRRPLRDAQLLYAASDVEFLLDLHQKQLQELEQLGRFSWLQEELSYSKYKLECKENIKTIKSTHKLTKEQEKRFLTDFNLLVQSLSESLKINKTLVFSKKSQKELLKFILIEGAESALCNLTLWRKELLLEKLLDLIKKYNLNF